MTLGERIQLASNASALLPLAVPLLCLRVLIFLLAGFLTRLLEPFKVPKPTFSFYAEEDLHRKATVWAERVKRQFTKDGYFLCELYDDKADGRNHYRGDWCLWYGVWVAAQAWRQESPALKASTDEVDPNEINRYLSAFVLEDGSLSRGFLWKDDRIYFYPEEGRDYEFDTSVDQLCGLTLALGVSLPTRLESDAAEKLARLAARMAREGRIPCPDQPDPCRDLRVGISTSAAALCSAATLLQCALRHTDVREYLGVLDRLIIWSRLVEYAIALPFVALVPSTRVAEEVPGFNHNITLQALAALKTSGTFGWWGRAVVWVGASWMAWLTRPYCNPWWIALSELAGAKARSTDVIRALEALDTFTDLNEADYPLNAQLLDAPGLWKRGRYPFGKIFYFTEPPPLSRKKGDAFLLQGCWRSEADYGMKYGFPPLLSPRARRFSMLTFLAPYWLMCALGFPPRAQAILRRDKKELTFKGSPAPNTA